MVCQVIHRGETTETFTVQTGVRQACLFPFLFLLAVDWTMKETTQDSRNGIQWTLCRTYWGLDFADYLALLSCRYGQMQNKISILEETAAKIGLHINNSKTEVMKINITNTNSIKLKEEEAVENITSFTYLGSIVNTSGGIEQDIQARMGKARSAFTLLKSMENKRYINRSKNKNL